MSYTKSKTMFNNPLILFVSAIIPMLVGAIWYGPLFGNAWMKTNKFTEKDLEGGNMAIILGLSYLLSIMLSFGLSGLAIHQQGVMQLFAMDPNFENPSTEVGGLFKAVMDKMGQVHRTFEHGTLHGAIASVLFALPLIAINALFERRGGQYIGIHFGYWLITFVLMSDVLCQWL